MKNHIEHVFMYLCAFCVTLLILRFFVPVLIGLLGFLLLNFKFPLYRVNNSSLLESVSSEYFLSMWLVFMCHSHIEEINFSIIAQIFFSNKMR